MSYIQADGNLVGSKQKELKIQGKVYPSDSWTNVPSTILENVPRKLHQQENHPISITRKLIESRFPGYQHHNEFDPVVTVGQNFDSLGFPLDHPGRSRTDTYYINKDTVLRTHTSAHQADVFRANTSDGFTISADVYRRDAIDRSHYPVFHQMEGAMTWDRNALPEGKTLAQQIWEDVEKLPKPDIVVEDPNPTTHPERNPLQKPHTQEEAEAVAAHLKRSLENVVVEIFSKAKEAAAASTIDEVRNQAQSQEPLKVRWIEAYFPFTSPSWELEIFWQGDWLEVLGCGVISQPLLDNADAPTRVGWAFGIGLERIAMLLYEIPDIRLFWSKDSRFLSQFDEKKIRRFVPFSKYPAAPRDVAFWLPKSAAQDDVVTATASNTSSTPSPAGGLASEAVAPALAFHENDIMEIVRSAAGDSVEDVTLVDEFTHPKTGRRSLCYRINYRSLESTLTKEQANDMHEKIRQELVSKFGVELR